MILKIQKFLFALLLISSLQMIASAQSEYEYESASVLLATRDAKLIVIGEVNSVARAYSKLRENQSRDDVAGDYTSVNFQVLEVLRGEYSKKDISVLFEGHLGFGDNSKLVLVLFDASSNLMSKYERSLFKLPLCQTQTCYATSTEWLFPATKDELPIFRGFLDSLKTNDKPKKFKN